MKKKSKDGLIHVSILGSCVSRDAFSIPFESGEMVGQESKYAIDRYIQGLNIFSAMHDPVEEPFRSGIISEIQNSSACRFYKKCFQIDVEKSWEKYLSEKKSEWLILDMTPMRLQCGRIGNSFLTLDDLGGSIYLGLPEGAPKENMQALMKSEKVDMGSLTEGELKELCHRYLDRIKAIYPEKRIIVVEAEYATTFVDGQRDYLSPVDYLKSSRFAADNKVMRFMYSCAKEYMPRAHFVDAILTPVSNIRHKWGWSGLHFVDDVYNYMYRSIDFIINSKISAAREKSYVEELRAEYSKRIFESFSHTAISCAGRKRNLLDYSLGMAAGVYEKNGVRLVINEDFSFSISGKATENTTLFLYHGDKNPIGAWKSARLDTKQGEYIFSSEIEGSPDRFYIQLVLTTEDKDKLWRMSSAAAKFKVVDKPYQYLLVRAVINAGVELSVSGRLALEPVEA